VQNNTLSDLVSHFRPVLSYRQQCGIMSLAVANPMRRNISIELFLAQCYRICPKPKAQECAYVVTRYADRQQIELGEFHPWTTTRRTLPGFLVWPAGHRGGGKPHAWVLATPSARLVSPRNCTPLECTEMIRCYCNRGRLCPRVNTAESQAFFQMSRVARIQATREIGIRQRRRSILPLVFHDTSPSNMPPP
jgi:hypothetical protein